MMNFGSLFSGIGGFDLGFERAGMTCAWQVEIDKNCQAVLKRHFGDKLIASDIKTVAKRIYDCEYIDEDFVRCPIHDMEFGDCPCLGADEMLDDYPVDVLVGGFPCQDISSAKDRWGANGISGEKSGLWSEYARVIRELDTEWVVIENTGRLRNGRNGSDFRAVVGQLDELGYMGVGIVLDSAAFGLPARRSRVIFVARNTRGGTRSFSDAERLAECFIRNDPGCVILQGGGQSFAEDYGAKRPSPKNYRKLTPTECERLQGFPDGWTAGFSDSTRYKMLGNAVTVNVAEWIGKRIVCNQ